MDSPEGPKSAASSGNEYFCFGSTPRDDRRIISKNEMRDFREAFRLFDKDGDGSITKEELGSVMRSLGQYARGEELQEMLAEIDRDGDGNVSFEEFVDIMSTMTTDTPSLSAADQEEKELRDAFRVFDKHNRGYITASDLRAVLQCLGEDLDEDESEYRELIIYTQLVSVYCRLNLLIPQRVIQFIIRLLLLPLSPFQSRT